MSTAVVIPLYKIIPSKDELLSLKQCIYVLNNYKIIFVVPFNFNVDHYLMPSNYEIKQFSNHFFQSITGYNAFLKSYVFYFTFKDYKHILIYQLDAYVFKDDLSYWINKDYDYIGAPWFDKFTLSTSENKIIGVGNGGFSLRNVDKSINIIKRIYYLRILNKFIFNNKLAKYICAKPRNLILRYVKFIFSIGDNPVHLQSLLINTYANEDGFWSIWVSSTFWDYSVAPLNDAIDFSFEVNPSLLYSMNDYKLPFGCHAWRKYEFDIFWKKYIYTKQ